MYSIYVCSLDQLFLSLCTACNILLLESRSKWKVFTASKQIGYQKKYSIFQHIQTGQTDHLVHQDT